MPKRKRLQTRNTASSWPVTYRWLATGTLVAYTAIGCHKLAAAPHSQRLNLPTLAAFDAAADLPPRRFDISAGLLQDAIDSFRRTTGLEVRLLNEGIGKLSVNAVSGLLTPGQALDRLLKDTGVHWRFINPNSVLLELNSVSATVDVSASATALATSIAKYPEPIRDTPQTVNVVGQQVMAEQNTTTLRDALRNVAGISIAAGEGGAQGDNLTIRGFSARNDLYIDGMRDSGSYYRDPFNLEEVDVVQGPSAATFGRGSTGGVVNQATKMPTQQRAISGTFDGGTDGTRRATADLNLPVPAFGIRTAGSRANRSDAEKAESRRIHAIPLFEALNRPAPAARHSCAFSAVTL